MMTAENSSKNGKSPPPGATRTVLVTGATGYIGGRLVPRLLRAGYKVRVMVRGSTSRLEQRAWFDDVELVVADVLAPETLPDALQGVDTAYYMIHSMRSGDEFHERDRRAARNFGAAAVAAGVQRIIYLGGLGREDADLSEHLRSRQETGEVLRESGVPVTEFRAAIVVGSGSASFEMIRHLTERLPVMIAPRWLYTRVQPIAIGDLLRYMVEALRVPDSAGQIVEVGGADILTYDQMIQGYAAARGLRRLIIPVPVLTPRLSSYWVHWTTPIPSYIAQPLIDGLRNEVIVHDDRARRLFPNIVPMSYRQAVELALSRLREGQIETIWSSARASSVGDRQPVLFTGEQGLYIERRHCVVAAAPETVYRVFTGLGGYRGWPPYNWLWEIRGLIDRLVGGVGLRRGRRHPDELMVGDALDFWRVEKLEPDRLLRLRAEMKVPGRAWLQFEAQPLDGSRTELVQTAYFAPRGLLGLLYWYGVYPFHGPVFSRLIEHVAAQSEQPGQVPGRSLPDAAASRRRSAVLLLGSAVAVTAALSLWLARRQQQGN